MKKIILFFFFFLTFLAKSQNLDDIIYKREKNVDSMTIVLQNEELSDDKLTHLLNAREILKICIKDILQLDNFSNPELQKALLQPLITGYYDAFTYTSDGKKINTIRYGFDSKEDFIQNYKVAESLLLGDINKRQYDVLIESKTAQLSAINNYINKNLKRLGISREQYDDLSEKDKLILEKQFY